MSDISRREFLAATATATLAGRFAVGAETTLPPAAPPAAAKITAASDGVSNVVWNVAAGEDAHSRPAVLHAAEGETIHVPHLGAEKVLRADYSLLERRGNTFTRDCFDALSVKGGFLAVKGLEPGDYSLKIKREGREIPVRVTAGEMIGRFAAGSGVRVVDAAGREITPEEGGWRHF